MKTSAPIPYINLLRVTATVAVIFIHVGAMFQSSCDRNSCENSFFQYEFIHRFCSFAVPVFILISGSLLLNPEKEITYRSILHKYIPRIAWALLLFGSVMNLTEAYITRGCDETLPDIVLASAINLLTGNCWDHMWYLYMLIGLYALTPVYKAFINQSDRTGMNIFMGFMTAMCIVLPYLKQTDIAPINSYLTLPVFLFLYPCGYYIGTVFPKKKLSAAIAVLILIAYCLHIAWQTWHGHEAYPGYDPLTVFAALAISHLGQYYNSRHPWLLNHLSKHCFCIYIIHAIILNVAFKVLHIENILHFVPFINAFVVVLFTFLLSCFVSCLLRQIPFLREKVL